MARVKRGTLHQIRRKKVIKLAKGYRGRSKKCYRLALQSVEKGLQYAYRDRKNKKRSFRALWIQRINAAAREHGLTYSQFMHGMKLAAVELDRKVLADIAVHDAKAFAELAKQAQGALDKGTKKAA